MIGLKYRDRHTGATLDEFEQVVSGTKGYLGVEHNDAGEHTAVTAESLSVAGPVVITQDDRLCPHPGVQFKTPSGSNVSPGSSRVFSNSFNNSAQGDILCLSSNVNQTYDGVGTTATTLDDVGRNGALLSVGNESLDFSTAAAGTSPVSLTTVVQVNATQGMYINSGGIVLAGTGGIHFPSTEAASADVNTLDDYEEGDWTPTIGGSGGQSGQVYSSQSGRYTKIGRLVHIQGQVTLSTLGTITTNAQIQNLPFASGIRSTIHIGYWGGMTSTYVYIGGIVNTGATTITLTGATAAATGHGFIAQADMSATSDFVFSATYSV